MDQDQELRRAKWLLAAIASFVVTGYFAFDEMRYALWGRVVAANVVQAKQVATSSGRGRRAEMISVEYSFPAEGGGNRTERDLLPADWPAVGSSLPVEYIPGSPDSSRAAGHRNVGSVYLFLGSLALILGFLFVLYREAKASERRPTRRSR